ncbi:hypothetical protein [Flavobacterium sp.]|uniref:hypothetical protein n=1 Tax=Flavobacterium sp. TaxID=239 RepID=UPI003751C0CF
MARTIYFKKEENRNVTIRVVGTEKIIYSLLPTHNVIQDRSNSENIIIKSATSSFDDRGIVIPTNTIDYRACVPAIVSSLAILGTRPVAPVPNDYLLALMRDFFFDVAHEIKYVNSLPNLPLVGSEKIIYITRDTHQQYFWNGSIYLPYFGIVDFDNIILSDTQFIKTFYLDFPLELLTIDYSKQKMDILFPDVNVEAEIDVVLQSDLFVGGSIIKNYSVSKTQNGSVLNSYKSKNATVTDMGILNTFSLSDLFVKTDDKRLSFSISNRFANMARRLKVAIHYKARTKKLTALGVPIVKHIYNNMEISTLYKSAVFFPTNHETKPSLPLDFYPPNLHSVMIHPVTKELRETFPLVSSVRISKEIDFRDNIYSYIGSKAGDYLDIPDTTNKLLLQIVPSNILTTFLMGGVLRNVRIVSNDNNVEIKLYLFSVTQTTTSNGLQTTLSTPRLIADCGTGVANFGFTNPIRNVSGGEILMMTVKSRTNVPRKVILEGVINFLTA